jgi:hypothetical protein
MDSEVQAPAMSNEGIVFLERLKLKKDEETKVIFKFFKTERRQNDDLFYINYSKKNK